MVTNHHEVSHTLFDDDPDLIVRALERCGVHFSKFEEIERLGTDLSTVEPVERRVDRVFKFRTADGREGIFAFETQLQTDHDKPRAWGYYGMTLANRYSLPVTLVVVTSSKRCEEWARKGFDFGHGLGDSLYVRPIVLGPSNVEMIIDDHAAAMDLYYTALSVTVHLGSRHINAILKAAAKAVGTAPEPTAVAVANNIDLTLGRTDVGDFWRQLMAANSHVVYGPMIQGMLDEAKAKAEAKGMAKLLLKSLDLRGIVISDEQRERIATCTDEQLIEEWFARAVTATTAEDVFNDRSGDL
ncbi:hypothetical protein [Actinospica robiniae]|uniref:hypothetical protein n=1 Tax=Actinospica robiniae TaxID=304901 RepID=UPI0003F7A3C2|nr:hypothetical protein [Actinospica robiniae]